VTTLVVFLGVCLAAGFVTLAVALTLGRVLDARDAQVSHRCGPDQWYDGADCETCRRPVQERLP